MTSSVTQAPSERWVLLAAILASSMAFIDSSALDVVAPSLQSDLAINGQQLFWVINSYALFLAALILVGGSLGDLYGRKRVFRAGIVLFTIASMACGLAPTADLLIIFRGIQGIGGALMVPGSLALLSATFNENRRGQAIGTWSTFSTMTTLLGPVIGGFFAGQGLWRLVFFINLPLAMIALFALNKVPESRNENMNRQLDYAGALLATLGLGGLTYGFIEAPRAGFNSPLILFALVGGVVALIAFVIVEARSTHPMVPLPLFRSRTFSGANLLTFFLYSALRIVPFFFVLNLVQIQNYPQEVAGFTFLPFGILLTLMSRWAGGLVDRVGAKLPLVIGPIIAGVGFFLFALPGITNGPQDYWTTYFPAVIVAGIGMGVTVAPLTTAVMGAAPTDSSGTASGINNAVARTAGVLAVAIFGAIAITLFSNALETRTENLNLSPDDKSALMLEGQNLGNAQPPQGLAADQTAQVETMIDWSFIQMFRTVAIIGAGLAWLSALLAAVFVASKVKGSDQTEGDLAGSPT